MSNVLMYSLSPTCVTPERAMPDHSILHTVFELPYYKHEDANETVSTNSEVLYEKVNNSINKRLFLKHNCDNLPEHFMNNEDILDQIQSTIYRIEQRSRTLESIDDIYESLCQIYYTEMDVKLKYFNVNCQKRARRSLKPWWNQNLKTLFDDFASSEKIYLKCKRRQHKTQLFNEFKYKRKLFDREYRKAKRNFLHEEKVGISESETKNPSEFWSKLKNLGKSTNKKSIPNEVLLESGKVSHEQSDILKHWRDTFSEIYNPYNTDEEHEPNQQIIHMITLIIL